MKTILILSAMAFGADAFGAEKLPAKFAGYAEPATETSGIVVTVDRVKPTRSQLLILFDHREAYYAFPARKEDRDEIELYLKKAAHEHRELHVRINPRTAHIVSIEEK